LLRKSPQARVLGCRGRAARTERKQLVGAWRAALRDAAGEMFGSRGLAPRAVDGYEVVARQRRAGVSKPARCSCPPGAGHARGDPLALRPGAAPRRPGAELRRDLGATEPERTVGQGVLAALTDVVVKKGG
jgi:hypothetical protein